MSNDNNFASANLTVGRINAAVKKMGGEDVFYAFLRGEYVLTKVAEAMQKLLTQVDNLVAIPATTTKFVAAVKFVVNTKKDDELKISYLGDNFKKWFLNKVENPHKGSKLKVQKLNKNSGDQPILEDLGGEVKAETSLYEMFEFLKTVPHAWYIFYIKDVSGHLRAVHVRWRGGGWYLNAFELHFPVEWDAYDHVVSRN